MATKKVGEESRKTLIFHTIESLKSFGFDVLQTGSNTYAVPIVENGEEGAIEIVFKIPKGPRDGSGYDPFEAAQSYTFHEDEKRVKAQRTAEKKAKKSEKKD
jgi:hypothetical protein